jgi:hypothetical protein
VRLDGNYPCSIIYDQGRLVVHTVMYTSKCRVVWAGIWSCVAVASRLEPLHYIPLPAATFADYALGSAINTAFPSLTWDGRNSVTLGNAYNCQTLKSTVEDLRWLDQNTWDRIDEDSSTAVEILRGQYKSNQVYVAGDFAFVSRPKMTTIVDRGSGHSH